MRWTHAGQAERSNAPPFLIKPCDLLGVDRPPPASGGTGSYRFERNVTDRAEDARDPADRSRPWGQASLGTEGRHDVQPFSTTARKVHGFWSVAALAAWAMIVRQDRGMALDPPPVSPRSGRDAGHPGHAHPPDGHATSALYETDALARSEQQAALLQHLVRGERTGEMVDWPT